MKEINPTTYQADTPDKLEVVIGDEKQDKFFPRVKLKKWGNEANFSVGLADPLTGGKINKRRGAISIKKGDTTARFYELSGGGSKPLKHIRRALNGNHVTALQATSEFELVKHIYEPGTFYLAHYIVTEPSIAAFDLMPANLHMEADGKGFVKDFNYTDKSAYHPDDIPIPSYDRLKLVRFYTPYTPVVNPCYMEAGVHQIDMQWFGTDMGGLVAPQLMDAVQHVLKKQGIQTMRHTTRDKLYFKHKNRWVKFFSAQENETGVYAYINVSAEYNKAYDFYRTDIEKDIRDQYAYGIQFGHPRVSHDILEPIMKEFAKRLRVPLKDEQYTKKESSLWQTIQKLQDNTDWSVHAKRNDANWFLQPQQEGFEFEVVLSKKPSSNEIQLTCSVPKNVTAYYQAELSYEQMIKEGLIRPPNIQKSLAIYHTEKKGSDYKTGKIAHIDRPIAHDATGHSVFCDFKDLVGMEDGQIIDLSQGLTISVPQEFIDTAVYPITIDPTFGYTTAGGSFATAINTIKGTVQTAPTAGLLTSLSAHISNGGAGSAEYEGAIYRSSDNSLVAQTTNSTTVNPSATWVTLDLANEEISAIDYILSFWGTSTGGYGGQIDLYYDSTGGKTSKTKAETYSANNWPNPITWDSDEANRQYSIYVTHESVLSINLSDGNSQVSGPKIV